MFIAFVSKSFADEAATASLEFDCSVASEVMALIALRSTELIVIVELVKADALSN
jgi:hypothetical protein